MRNNRLYQTALVVWSFFAGMAVLFAAFWLLEISPDDIFSGKGTIPGRLEGPVYHEYERDLPHITQVGGTLVQERSNAIITSVQDVSPAVVSIGIIVEQRYVSRGYRDWMDLFYDRRPSTRTVQKKYPKVGTGFLINSEGIIVTNHHVIEAGTDIIVTLQDGRDFEGRIIGIDKTLDIAILKISGRNLPYAILGDSDDLVIGEWAIAIGNPFASMLRDNNPTVTVGVVSAVDRQFIGAADEGRYYQNMIQTDAAINPGNSGGPLVNARGEVIGMNTFIFTPSGGSVGLGFARPINEVKYILQEIQTYGRVREVAIPFGGQPFNRRQAEYWDLPGKYANSGILVTYIDPEGAAYEAGLRKYDVVYKMNNVEIKGADDANAIIRSLKVGDTLTLTVYRQGEDFDISFRVSEDRP